MPERDTTPSTADTDLSAAATTFSRRSVIKGATAVTAGLAASTYVKPGLRALGVPGAAAQVSGSPSEPPPCQPGFHLLQGICVPCPDGYTSDGRTCVVNTGPCKPGFQLVGGICVPIAP